MLREDPALKHCPGTTKLSIHTCNEGTGCLKIRSHDLLLPHSVWKRDCDEAASSLHADVKILRNCQA